MSHSPERKQKDCLNCGSIVLGRYCQVCGQENIEPKETFWGMVTHFFNDITHFDGKFFTTLKDLIFKPGFLSAEYIRGRRMSYLHPIRMYVFTSAIFFLVFFSLKGTKDIIKLDGDVPLTKAQRNEMLIELREDLKKDSFNINLLTQIEMVSDTSKPLRTTDLLPYYDNFTVVGTIGGNYKTRREYDSVQLALPAGDRDGLFKRLWNKKAVNLNERYKTDPALNSKTILDSLLHKLPYLLFASLPFFALILKLLYVRRRKNYYYADHAIFSVHHYILSFILLLLSFLYDKLNDISGWGIWKFLIIATIIFWPVHLYLAMKRFYRQGWFKTFLKFFLLNILGLLVLVFLLVFFSIFSIFQL